MIRPLLKVFHIKKVTILSFDLYSLNHYHYTVWKEKKEDI